MLSRVQVRRSVLQRSWPVFLLVLLISIQSTESSSSSDQTCAVGDSKEVSCEAMARQILKKVLSVEQAEGVGARVRRSVGRPEVSAIAA